MRTDELFGFLWLTAGLLVASLVLVLVWQSVNRSRLGRTRFRVRRRRRARVALILAAVALSIAVVAGSEIGREPVTVAVLILSITLIAVCPGFQDSVWGEQGVQRGWYARRLEDLEAWRLIGEHLRWKLFGEWVATDVPIAEHAALRQELEKRAPGRESVHGNAGFDPQRAAASNSNS
ncbi:MAG TPA: hypothetical protein VK843_21415 [Planctomycetota bacterium]|nr:hypothetical protein [Planctomycetota bacterium]